MYQAVTTYPLTSKVEFKFGISKHWLSYPASQPTNWAGNQRYKREEIQRIHWLVLLIDLLDPSQVLHHKRIGNHCFREAASSTEWDGGMGLLKCAKGNVKRYSNLVSVMMRAPKRGSLRAWLLCVESIGACNKLRDVRKAVRLWD